MKRILACVLLSVLLLSGCSLRAIAFKVNGLSVEKDELIFHMERLSDVTVASIEDEYNLIYEGQDGYWQTKIGDTTPLDVLKDAAVDEIVRIKVIQLAAKNCGIDSEMLYSKQLKNWKRDNEQRIKDDAAGKVVYGVVERTFYTYIHTYFLEIEREYQNFLTDAKIITISEAEMKQYYINHPDYFENANYEDVVGTINGWIFDNKYEVHVQSLLENVTIEYENMYVDPSQFE